MKRLFLTVSVCTLLSAPAFATWQQEVQDQVNLEVGQNKMIQRLANSRDFTIDLDKGALTNTIAQIVKVKNDMDIGGRKPEVEEIKLETYHEISNKLEYLKTHRVDIGAGWSTTTNKHRSLCVENADIPLVYPTSRAERDLNDSYLPVGARGNFMSKPLYDHIKEYVGTLGLTAAQSKRLYANLEPLFYVTQQEVIKLIEGGDNPYHRARWVYGKNRDGIIDTVKGKVVRHNNLISEAGLVGFARAHVENVLVPDLVGIALDRIPLQLRELYNDGRNSFRIGKNARGAISLIRPDVDNLAYPVLQNDRLKGVNIVNDMNIPFGYVSSQGLNNQWSRVKQFVIDDPRIGLEEKKNVQKLLEPVGHLFHNAAVNLRVLPAHYPERAPAIDGLRAFQHQYRTTHTIPEDALNAFYNHHVALTPFLAGLKVKSATHEAMTSDLLPVGLRGDIVNIRNNLLEGLVFEDMVDRFKVFYPDVVLF